jgi:hypothetical protein
MLLVVNKSELLIKRALEVEYLRCIVVVYMDTFVLVSTG